MLAAGWRIVGVLGAVLLSGCTNAQNPPLPEPAATADTLRVQPIEAVAEAARSGIQDRRREVVRSESEWRQLWSELAAGRIPPPEPPAIDFERRMVIVAAMGRRSTGGYAIRIESVRAAADSLYVTVVEVSPGAGCLTTQALTAPVTAVSLERHAGHPVYVERQETRDCG